MKWKSEMELGKIMERINTDPYTPDYLENVIAEVKSINIPNIQALLKTFTRRQVNSILSAWFFMKSDMKVKIKGVLEENTGEKLDIGLENKGKQLTISYKDLIQSIIYPEKI